MAEDVKTEEAKTEVEPPAYMVTSAMQAVRKHLNTKQKTSSYFQEAPHVAGKVLRRGSKVFLTEKQMELNGLKLKRLFDAHAIEIYKMTDGEPVSMREQIEGDVKTLKEADSKLSSGMTKPEGEPETPPPPESAPPPPGEVSMNASDSEAGTEVVQPSDEAGKVSETPTDGGTHRRKRSR